jgi:hypothetical protein
MSIIDDQQNQEPSGTSNSYKDVAEEMEEFAGEAVAIAKWEFDIELDYSENSLASVDAILSTPANQLVEKVMRRGVPLQTRPNDTAQDLIFRMSKMWGAYVGEVVRRHHSGVWKTRLLDGYRRISIIADRVMWTPSETVYLHLMKEPSSSSSWSVAEEYKLRWDKRKDVP